MSCQATSKGTTKQLKIIGPYVSTLCIILWRMLPVGTHQQNSFLDPYYSFSLSKLAKRLVEAPAE